MRRWSISVLFTILALSGTAVSAQDKTKIKVGVSVGNSEQTFEVVKRVAARDGLDIQIKTRGYKLVPVGLTITAPLGIYSKKYKSIDQLPQGASIGIQNDPSNGNRALLLLQKAGLIKLKPGVGENGTNATPLDVIENPKKLKLVELDAAQLPRSLDDLAAASINNDYAFKAGLSLQRDTIAVEDAKGRYANLIVTRVEDKDKPWAKKLVKAYQSDEVRKFIEAEFKGSLVPAF